MSASASYTDNLAGVLFQSLISSGGSVLPTNNLDSSHAWDLNAAASYRCRKPASPRTSRPPRSELSGREFWSNSYSAGVTYAHSLFGGTFNTALSVIDSMIDGSNQNASGFPPMPSILAESAAGL